VNETAIRLEPGVIREATYVVTREMSPPHVDGILATSRMIGLIEDTCLAAVGELLDASRTTVGTHVDISHVATARLGEHVHITVRLVKVTQQRLLTFDVSVEAGAGVIGTGTHQRLVVERSRFVDFVTPSHVRTPRRKDDR
jgi:fluoroacetyl-CoA thioesterase